jgi:hypothetical protein
MDELPPPIGAQAESQKAHRTSLAARLLNVFAVPGEVFEEVKTAPSSMMNWLAPTILLALVGALSAVVIFSQPAIQQKMREEQAKMVEKNVQAGKMTREQADQYLSMVDKFVNPTVLKIASAAGAVFVSFIRVFWWALVLWLLGRFLLKAQFGFPKTLEMVGLAMMINVLGTVVTMLLIVNLAKLFATPSLALAIGDFDATRKSHLFAGAANVFAFWFIGVTSVGLTKLASVPFFRAAMLVFAFWVLQDSLFILSGLGQFAL